MYTFTDHKHTPYVYLNPLFFLSLPKSFSFFQTHTWIDPRWQRCGFPGSAYTTRWWSALLHIYILIGLSTCLCWCHHFFCLDSKLFGAFLAARVTTMAFCWISLLTFSVHCFCTTSCRVTFLMYVGSLAICLFLKQTSFTLLQLSMCRYVEHVHTCV